MSDNGNNNGLFGDLFLGLGLAGLIALPFTVARRFGVSALALISAISMTAFAAAQPTMLAWARDEVVFCQGRMIACPAETLASLAGGLPGWAWWAIASMSWGAAILLRHQDQNS